MLIVAFIINFRNQVISPNITDWGSFGSYVGGIMTPMFSLVSLIVLVYIYVRLNENDVEANKALQKKLKRIEAHAEIIQYPPKYKMFYTDFINELKYYKAKLKVTNSDQSVIEDSLDKYRVSINKFQAYFSHLQYFISTYSHLFEYDFSNKDFQELISTGEKIEKHLTDQYDILIEAYKQVSGLKPLDDIDKTLVKHQDLLGYLIDKLTIEVNRTKL